MCNSLEVEKFRVNLNMDYFKIAPSKLHKTLDKNSKYSLKNTKIPPKNANMPLKNTKSPHQNQNLSFRGIFVFFRRVFGLKCWGIL